MVRRRWFVFAAWAAFVGVLAALSVFAGGRFVDTFAIPGAESTKATDLLEERFPSQAGDSAVLVFEAEDGIASPRVRNRVQDLVEEARGLPGVTSAVSPFEAPNAVSEDGEIAYATLQYAEPASSVGEESVRELLELADEADGGGLRVEAGGPVVSAGEVIVPRESEAIGIGVAAIVLLLAFGSVVAMGLPIITALTGLGAGLLLVALAARAVDLLTTTPAFVSMIGLGVGIDYALFIVTRYRENLAAGLGVEESVCRAIDTSGRSVIAAGAVVVISLLGLFAIGLPFISALGMACAAAVAIAVLVAVSLLPALLGLAGRGIDRWRVPGLGGGQDDDGRSSPAYRLGRGIQNRPVPFALASAAFLLALTTPVLGMRLGISDDGNRPASFDSRRAYDLLSEGFGPGFNGPLLVTVENDDGLDPATLETLTGRLGEAAGVEAVTPAAPNPEGDTAVVTVYPTTSPQDEKTTETVERLRESVIPRALEGTGAAAYVGGITAVGIDANERIAERTPLFFGLVVGLSFLLLMAVFRSLAVPVKAAAMNLLSIGVAHGVLVAIFQWGWGAELLGVVKEGPIDAFVPVMLFAILFGLSTDYEVFLVSRIRESYLKTGDARGSVAEGLGVTARVITAAAAVMVSVFLSFALAEDRVVKEFGVGLATAVLVDATVIRLFLVPSLMALLGRWNWSLPRFLDRLIPELDMEGSKDRATPPPPP